MVYVTSDTHGAFDIHKINPREFEAASSMGENDYLLICGDFGCIWDGANTDRFWLNWLESLPWTTLFIDGNHENFDVLNSYPVKEWNGGKVHEIRPNILHLMRGEVFQFDNKKWLALGGGYSHDAHFREQGVNWWSQEIFTKEEAQNTIKNLEKNNWSVDCIVSHDVYGAHSLSSYYPLNQSRYDDSHINQFEFFDEIRKKTDYKIWLCGHYHKDALEFTDGKPCRMLFDDVLEIDDILALAARIQQRDEQPTAAAAIQAESGQEEKSEKSSSLESMPLAAACTQH